MGLVRIASSRMVSVLAALSLLVGMLVVTAQPARAADDGVDDLLQTLGKGGGANSLAAWTSGLAGIDKFGEQLPLVAASPGGLLGLNDVFKKAITDQLESATTFGNLEVDKDIDLGDGRTGHLKTTVTDLADGKKLRIVATVNRQVKTQDLKLSNANPKVELSVSDGVTVDLHTKLDLSLVWTGTADNRVYVVRDATSPRVDVDAAASIDNATAKASIGILGVSLDGSTLNVKAHLFGTISDPNNDGKLFFDETSTGDGELAKDGSLDGLFSAGLDPQGSDTDPNTRGSVHAEFKLGAAAAGIPASLPSSIAATIKVDWDDIGTGAPVVSAPDLASTVGKFQNMSLRDLAEGLAQVITGLTAIQKAKFDGGADNLIGDLDLPFMKGTLADAIQVNKILKDFLAANTVPAPGQPGFQPGITDPAQAGQPTFTSLQDLLKKLDEATGIDLSNLDWNTTTSKLALTLAMTKAAPNNPVDLDPISIEASGSNATYDTKTLTVSGAGWSVDQWKGRRVMAGTSAGEVQENNASTITLKTDWIGGKPAPGTPFVITGSEPHTGAVTFANRVQENEKGILNANSDQTFAKVTPSFSASLTLVLDLQDPKTGQACVGFEGNNQPCPFTDTSGPLETVVPSLPLNTDRLMIRTGSPLFTADFPIDTKVDLTANAGFFKVRLTGNLKMCNSSLIDTCASGTPTGHMLSVGLKDQGDLRMSGLFTKLKTPAQLLDVDVNIRAYGDVTVSVPDAPQFLPPNASTTFKAKWNDLTKPTDAKIETGDLGEIFKLDFDAADPKALFTALIKTLQTLSKQLAQANTTQGSGVFGKEIPGLGKSLRDLLLSDESNAGEKVSYGADTIKDTSRGGGNAFTASLVGRSVVVGTQVGVVKEVPDGQTLKLTKPWESVPPAGTPYGMRSALDDAIDQLLANTPDNIQSAVELLNRTLISPNAGLTADPPVKFRYLEVNGQPNLVLDVNWDRKYRAASPIRLSLGNLNGSEQTFAGAQATGMAQVDVKGNVKVGLAVPLAPGAGPGDGAALKVLEDSSISVAAKATLENGIVKGVVGPLSIALGNPTAGAPDAEKAQAKADLSIDLKKDNAQPNTPVSFDDFIGNVAVKFNESNGTVSCGEALTTKLMVCGKLPIFLNNSGADNGWVSIGEMALRIPDSNSPADLTDLDDNLPAPDDAKKEFELPADFASRLAAALLDFKNFGDGLDGYLAAIEQAFRTASFNGKLPLIGEDLQQGADFIGDLRTELRNSIWNQLPGGGRPANSKEFKDFINAKLADALKNVQIAATKPEVSFDCGDKLAAASAPTVTENPANVGTTTWQYKIVAHQGDGTGPNDDTKASGIGETTKGAAELNGTNFNQVSWTAVPNATGYKILRKGPGDTEFKLIHKQSGTTPYKDEGTGTPTAYTEVSVEPGLEVCPLASIKAAFLEFTAKRGTTVNPTVGCQPAPPASDPKPTDCFGAKLPLDIGIPGLALREGRDGTDGISVAAGFELHFKLGLSKEDGFFVNTHDGWGSDNKAHAELQVGLAFDLPASMVAELAFITIDVNKKNVAAGPLFAGSFGIDLKSHKNEGSCFKGDEAGCAPDEDAKIKFADLGGGNLSDHFGISLKGDFNIDWMVQAKVDSAFPGVRANFQLTWGFDYEGPGENTGGNKLKIAFLDVGISAGTFFEGLLGDVVNEIKRVTGPVQPVIDTLYAPIPVLSDLSRMAGGGDVTLITLAKAFNTLAGGPSLAFVDTIKAIIEFINRLPKCEKADPNDCFVPLGSFTLVGDTALNTSNSPTTADKMYDAKTPRSGTDVKSDLNTKNTNPKAAGKPIFGSQGLTADPGDAEKSGFKFPILDDPASAFNLLMGGDIDLVTFNSGPLTLGFSWRQSFGPVYAPPPVFVTLSGSASVTLQIRAGLDTYGIRKAVEAAQNGTPVGTIDVLDGLFFKTVDDAGNPAPVVRLDGEIAAGASVSVIIIEVGIEGGLRLTVGFFWNDPNKDGKFRVSEFLHAALNNPLCLFTVSGRLSLFLRVYITIGISIFSTTFSFTLADVTLLDFSVSPDCTPPPPKLGGTTDDGTLVVYAGKFGGDTFRGNPWGNNRAENKEDVVKVISLHNAQTEANPTGEDDGFDGFAVEMLGERREYHDPGLKRVVVDGTGHPKPMKVTFIGDGKKDTGANAGNSPKIFDRDAIVIGGTQNDVITTGRGLSYVNGGGGDDIIVTGDTGSPAYEGAPASKARVAGGAGKDTVSVGNGDNLVAGDASLGSATRDPKITHNKEDGGGTKDLTGVFDWTSIPDPTTQAAGSSQGEDTIGLGLGQNKARGNGANDTIGVAVDMPDGSLKAKTNTIIGDGGSDKITGGSNADKIFTAADTEFGVDEPGPADTGATNVVDTGNGNDNVFGSTGIEAVTSHSLDTQGATIRGGSANDVLTGGFGKDKVYGGPGDDYVIAEPAEVGGITSPSDIIGGVDFGPKRSVTRLALPAGVDSNEKTLVGGLGNDHIVGGDGEAKVFGDKLVDPDEICRPGDPVTSDPIGESTSQAGGDGNDRILGGAGIDTVSGGGASDRAELFGGKDLACGQEGKDVLFGGGDNDQLWGGSNDDVLYGEAGSDEVFGNDGNDVQYGGSDGDVAEGNDGKDWLTGSAGNDILYGGTRAAKRADSGDDDLYGDTGADRLIGDNGTVGTNAVPFDLDGLTPTAGAGDRIHGGDDADTAYGGLGEDKVNGNAGNDHLEGNNAKDTVHGNDGEDHVVGGSFQEASAGVGRPDTGDLLFGDAGPDLMTGDNAILSLVADPAQATPVTRHRGFAANHKVELLDLGGTPAAGTSGKDEMFGGDQQDVLYGQDGEDRAKGDGDDDYVEGGQASDWVEGNLADDDLVGGSSTLGTGSQPDTADAVFGGPGDDVVAGDNGQVLRPAQGQTPTRATVRIGTEPGQLMAGRIVELHDLAAAVENRFGADRLSGGEGVDVMWGQDGGDFVSGGAHADHIEGNGGADVIRGDLSLAGGSDLTTVVPLPDPDWPGSASGVALLEGALTPDGQDDIIGGSSAKGFRDANDTVEADGADDVVLGDNGSLVRTVVNGAERVYTDRYPNGAVPADATVSRTHDPDLGDPSTRFCTEAQTTCEVTGAFGNDTVYGEAGDDGVWGQDGNDTIYGGNDDDDLYGELGDDTVFGNDGEDAILGDRGGVVNQRLDTGDQPAQFTFTLNSVPQETYTGFRRGAYDRRVDLEHDVDGDQWIGTSTGPEMPHDGIAEGGRDRLRGGPGADNIHAGFGDDRANGDSHGDQVYGDDGEDVLWGGKGCDPVLDADTPDCKINGVFAAESRGTNDRFIDHTFGGVGEPDPAKRDILGSDILDFNPRGAYPNNCAPGDWPVTTGNVTVDPCDWFVLTDKHDDTADPASLKNNNHHHGTDWIYGGWDRDVLQGDRAQNGPNPGDRLIDWNGAYNLYTQCPASYGGYNDIRQHSPAMTSFLNQLAWATGAGRSASDVTTQGTSAYRELAFAYNPDFNQHAVGPAYPTTPGHFDDPVSCSD